MPLPRLLIISFSDLSSDARLLKQINAFSTQYDLYTCGYGPQPTGVKEHFQLDASWIHWDYDRTDLILRRYSRAYWSNKAVAGANRLLKGQRFDAILANDFDTVPLALSLKPAHGVHADLHEYAPREKEDLLRWRLFIKPFRTWICRQFLSQCASVTTVGAGIAAEYVRKFGLEKVGVVWNASPYADLEPSTVEEPLRLVHAGTSHRDRDLGLMIEAVAAANRNLTLDLYLTATDPQNLAELRERAAQVDGVQIHDAVPYSTLIRTLNNYDVGIHMLPPVNFNNQWALPNKLFDFVQARLGVIIGPSPEMRKIVDEVGNGAICDGFAVQDIARTLNTLTATQVSAWKDASNKAARSMSAESQITIWQDAIEALFA